MKTELNTKLVAILATAMNSTLAAIDREERKLAKILGDAWTTFITSKDGSEDHWTYFDEAGVPKRHGVLEFREAALAAGEKGGYARAYISGILRDVSDDFVLRVRKAGETRVVKVKFSDKQLAKIEEIALQNSLSKNAVKALLSALVA